MSIDKRTRQVSATHIVLVTPSPNGRKFNFFHKSFLFVFVCGSGRERGIVCVVKPQYGFVKCEKRPEPLFFHFNEFISGDSNVQIGDEIEFNVQPDNRTAAAFCLFSSAIHCEFLRICFGNYLLICFLVNLLLHVLGNCCLYFSESSLVSTLF